MPPPILDDSEDEEDDVVYDDSKGSHDSLSRSSGESAPGIPALDGTRDTLNQSTGSTGKDCQESASLIQASIDHILERLKRQINEAQWSLVGGSSEQPQINAGNPAHPDTVSPTSRRDKRRHSTVRHTEPGMSTIKRAKTITTYSTKKPSASSIEREKFINTFGDDATAPNTSPSIRSSEHSAVGGSSGLPAGSLQADFVNHEPAMFKESGSTIPDNESSHERMIEQALRSKSAKATSSPGMKLVESYEMPKSSSFPWSASEQTEAPRSHVARDEQATALGLDAEIKKITAQAQAHAQEVSRSEQASNSTNSMPVNEDFVLPGPATAVMIAPATHNESPQSSPIVQIKPVEVTVPQLAEPAVAPAEETKKPSRGRKRKVQDESSEPLNSDDIAVGLPKERYKPRPSRIRATEAVEEPIDFGVIPEKAAKSKRSKTMGNSAKLSDTQLPTNDEQSLPTTEPKAKPSESLDAVESGTPLTSKSSTNDPLSLTATQLYKPSPVVEVPATVETKPSQSKEATSQTVAEVLQNDKKTKPNDDFAFAKPAPKRKPASKSKRSSTTIFEDHVDFTGKSKSPSLSQQQALRQSALTDVKNEASPVKRKRGGKAVISDDDDEEEEEVLPAKSKRGRKVVLQDDDDEDELAYDPKKQDEQVDELADEPPKKRGRGRPPKTPSKPNADAPAKSAKQTSHEDAGEIDPTAPEEPPKKRGRGRPPKSAATVPDKDGSKNKEDANEDSVEPHEGRVSVKESIETPAEDSSIPFKTSATEIPTPSPEKQPSTETKAASSKTTKASPVAHSPIKSSSPAAYRVGLSKKHRIPSLLRVMRPPPPPSKRK
jgi:hypothetical protein